MNKTYRLCKENFNPTQGELIEVKDNEDDTWKELKFLIYNSSAEYPWVCQHANSDELYHGYKYARPVQKVCHEISCTENQWKRIKNILQDC